MNTEKIELLQRSLAETDRQIYSVQEELIRGMIDFATAEAKVNILKREEREKKKMLIAEVHIGKRGKTLAMGNYDEKKGLYYVRTTKRELLYSTTEDGLLDAMMEYYGLSLNSPYLGDIFERAIEKYRRRHPDKTKTVSNMRGDYKRFVNAKIAKTDIRKLNKDTLEEYFLNLVREKQLKIRAFKNCKTLFNLIYEKAIEEGFVRSNVAKEIDNNYIFHYCDQSLSQRKPEDVLYSDEEMVRIIGEAKNRSERYYSPFSYALRLQNEIGCRPSELMCLKWDDVDWENEIIHIGRSMIEDREPRHAWRVVDWTKNEKGVSQGGRDVPLSHEAIHILKELQSVKSKLSISSEWLFTDQAGKVKEPNGYSDFVNTVYAKVGVESKGTYAFRRAFAARLEAMGIEPSERALVLGHSVETTLKHYTFARPNYLNRIKTAFDEVSQRSA